MEDRNTKVHYVVETPMQCRYDISNIKPIVGKEKESIDKSFSDAKNLDIWVEKLPAYEPSYLSSLYGKKSDV